MADDPVITDPELYRVIFENDRVRVLDYRDAPGARTAPHRPWAATSSIPARAAIPRT